MVQKLLKKLLAQKPVQQLQEDCNSVYIFSVATSANSTGNVKIGIKNADSAIVSGQLEFYSSNSLLF